jgi:predicted NUDIX family phosphoesterase
MEQVFVVERADFFGGDWPQGFTSVPETGPFLARLDTAGRFVARDDAERQPRWKQVIPYCVIRRPGEVFCVQRKRAQTESRLHGLLSIGLGGHVNPEPDTPAASGDGSRFLRALQRELTEELQWDPTAEIRPRFCGLLNDDSNPVGQVHMGLVYAIDNSDGRVPGPIPENLAIREISKMSGGFRSLVELAPLWQDPTRFESWSRLLLSAGIAGPMALSEQVRRLAQR